MQSTVIERLTKDDQELTIFARKLEKKGQLERVKKILEKQAYLRSRIAEVAAA